MASSCRPDTAACAAVPETEARNLAEAFTNLKSASAMAAAAARPLGAMAACAFTMWACVRAFAASGSHRKCLAVRTVRAQAMADHVRAVVTAHACQR